MDKEGLNASFMLMISKETELKINAMLCDSFVSFYCLELCLNFVENLVKRYTDRAVSPSIETGVVEKNNLYITLSLTNTYTHTFLRTK